MCGCKLADGSLPDSPSHQTHDGFCGLCGSALTAAPDISLARSGLITQVSQKALDMLGYQQSEMQGKSFSVFVDRADLVIYFSHLNEVLNTGKIQRFEIALKHKTENIIYAQLECKADQEGSKLINIIHITLRDITDNQISAIKMQTQQDLLSLIFAMTNDINSVGKEHLDRSIVDALKKICLFARAERCFIYIINRPDFRLDPLYEWRQPITSLPGVKVKPKSISLSKMKHTMEKLRNDKNMIVHDIAGLGTLEREELFGWHYVDLKALCCTMIYLDKYPVGVIGVTKNTANGKWEPYAVSLVKFFGDFIASRLPLIADHEKMTIKPQSTDFEPGKTQRKQRADAPENLVDISDLDPDLYKEFKNEPVQRFPYTPRDKEKHLTQSTQPMVLSQPSGTQTESPKSVYQRSDGMVILTCPHCGIQETISVGQFKTIGIAIRVKCPCSKQFNVMLEKRRFSRKSVQLEGYFLLSEDLDTDARGGNAWGPMIVKDLSKTGLQFSAEKARLVHAGDLLKVRFNLDTANHPLIQKHVRVLSVNDHEVRCQFEGADSYDITLGFYFM